MAEHITGISLRDVQKLLDDKSRGERAFDVIDKVIDTALIFSPAVLGAAGLGLHALLEPKDRLVELIKDAIKAITQLGARDYLDRAEEFAGAHCLLTFSAFFEALNERLPDLMSALDFSVDEKWRISMADSAYPSEPDDVRPRTVHDLAGLLVAVPHPAGSEDPAKTTRSALYRAMGENLLSLLMGATSDARWNRAAPWERERVLSELEETIPSLAERIYHAGLVGLAIEFPQFLTWLVMADHEAKDALIRKIRADTRVQFELVGRAIDLGLRGLADEMSQLGVAMTQLSEQVRTQPSDPGLSDVAQGLHRAYLSQIDRPVIDDRYESEPGAALTYPTRAESYVPQAYRAAFHRGQLGTQEATHLERDEAWTGRPLGNDLGQFVLRYLESLYSTRGPLLILGHPGSGKSLLTQILAARLAYPTYTTVRVELRGIDPKSDIQRQIEAQIRMDTGEDVSWAQFSRTLPTPPVVILDGYDELLQATGSQYADYLDQVRLFQEREAVQHRPVRVLVTSRITLIDRTVIPPGTTVVRLEEFDDHRRSAWSDVWNRCNGNYFRATGVAPFRLPAGPSKVTELAGQPLLLLMLALYDSASNQLSKDPLVDQSRLYHALLIRFIRREFDKDGEGYRHRSQPEQEARVSRELERLGIAAIGMFNRQATNIRREDLDNDLAYFRAELDKPGAGGRPLSQADLLLGSFFFIHESRSEQSAAKGDSRQPAATFEFLHKTFGEFLTADFLLRQVLLQADGIAYLAADPRQGEMLQQQLASLRDGWFSCLVHTPLHTQPNVLILLKEWAAHQLTEAGATRDSLLEAVDRIILTQLRLLLKGPTLPVLGSPDRAVPYDRQPALGHLAIYSLNLIVLRAHLTDGGYVLNEADLGEQAVGCRAWDRLTSLWRSWFPPQSLASLAFQVTATRDGDHLVITTDRSVLLTNDSGGVAIAYNASIALADNLTTASLGLQLMSLAPVPDDFLGQLGERTAADAAELHPIMQVAASRSSQQAPPGLPVFSSDFLARYGHFERPGKDMRPSGLSVEYAEIADQLSYSPAVQGTPEIDPENDLYRFLLHLSRYAAEVFIRSRARSGPGWLPSVVERCGPLEWGELLIRPAAAPLIRAAIDHLSASQCAEASHEIGQVYDRGPVAAFDVDTAAAAAVLAWRGGLLGLCARILDSITKAARDGAWQLLDIPDQLWGDLTDLLVSGGNAIAGLRGDFIGCLELEVTRLADGSRSLDTHRTIQLARIGVRPSDQFHLVRRVLHDSVSIFSPGTSGEFSDRKLLLLLVRLVRETGRSAIVEELNSQSYGVSEDYDPSWKLAFGILEDQPPEAIDLGRAAAGLTYREAMDLRWLIERAAAAERELDTDAAAP